MNPKSLLYFLPPALLLVLSLDGSPMEDEARRYERLQTVPITLYPEVDLKESHYPAFVNERARPGDAIVISQVDALKTSFRISQLGIDRGDIWVYVSGDHDLAQTGRSRIEGAKGI